MAAGGELIQAWDILALVLVVFPLLTGGIWIQRPHLFIELSDLAVPVLIVSVFGAILVAKKKPLFEKSRVIQGALRLWTKWRNLLDRAPLRALFLTATLIGLVWAYASLRRHWALGSHTTDLGNYVNAMWNFAFGHDYYSPYIGLHLLTEHQSYSFLLLGPIFRLFPYAETLLIFQAMGLVYGGVAMFFLARQYLPKQHWGTYLLPWLYWAYMPLRNAYYSDFHPEVVMLTPFLWGIVGVQSRSWRARVLGILALVYALGLKEAVPPIMVAAGVSWILGAGPDETRSFTRKFGIAAAVAGGAAFFFDVYMLPKLYGVTHYHLNEYADFGSGFSDIILSPILKPGVFLSHIFGGPRPHYLFWTLGPLGFLPLVNPVTFLAALPGYLILFLSVYDFRIALGFHYAIIPAAGLFWSMPVALLCAEKWMGSRWLAIWLVFFALLLNGRSDLFRVRDMKASPHAHWLRTEMVPALSPDASVVAPEMLLPQLATRQYVYPLPVGSRDVDCVLEDSTIGNLYAPPKDWENDRAILHSVRYRSVFSCGSFEAFERAGANHGCFTSLPHCDSGT